MLPLVDIIVMNSHEIVLTTVLQGWQRKLSSLNVAQFPWDPKPEPTPTPVISNPPPIGSNYHQMDNAPLAQPQSTFSLPPLPPMQPVNDNSNGPRIKPEPGAENGITLPSYNGGSGMTAPQRAAQNLQATYGQRAAASINAIQSNLPQQGQQQGHQQNMQQQQHQQQQRPSNVQMPQHNMTPAQYQAAIAARQREQLRSMGGAQTDGADEIEEEAVGIMKRFDAQGNEVEIGRVEIDHMIRRKIEAMGRTMEGGGLMLPLKERNPAAKSKKRKATTSENLTFGNPHSIPSAGPSSHAPPQYDGVDDDDDDDDKSNVLKEEDLDEDAINSDLDDPDDGLNEEEDDDEGMGHIMLCMYDKVQRVKNKWCVFFIFLNFDAANTFLGSVS
jgi:transcription initiation factor TFIIA large subunit